MSLLEFTLTASLTQQDPGHRTRNQSIMMLITGTTSMYTYYLFLICIDGNHIDLDG